MIITTATAVTEDSNQVAEQDKDNTASGGEQDLIVN